jgi:hypothetical protein
MEKIKKVVLQTPNHFDTDTADEIEQNKYLRKIAYWVGYFIFVFNNLDGLVTNLLANEIGGGDIIDYAYIFMTGLTFNQKVELLDKLYTYKISYSKPMTREGEFRKRLDEIINKLKEIGKIRNTIVHANYYSLDKDGNVREKTRYAGPDVEEYWVGITRDFLVENINHVIKVAEEFDEFGDDFE